MKATPQISSCLTRDVRLSGRTHTAFTLVELIVVITILAILGTIGFVSFSGYTGSARDSTRSEDMSNIAKSLSVYMATNGKYPAPDGFIPLTSNGTPIGSQGTAGKTTLSSIKFNGAGLDPIDNLYYTYTVDSASQKFSLLSFFEGQSNITALNNATSSAYADATTGYATRFASVSGDPIGVFTTAYSASAPSLIPVQQTSATSLDIGTTPNSYTVYLKSKSSVTGGASALGALSFVRTSNKILTTGEQTALVDIMSTIGLNQSAIRSGAQSVGTGTLSTASSSYLSLTGSTCAAVGSNGNIYNISNLASTNAGGASLATTSGVSYITPSGSTGAIAILTTAGAAYAAGANTFGGCTIAQNGNIYATPASTATNVFLEINPTAGTATVYTMTTPSGAVGTAYKGAVLAPTGKIYTFPTTAGASQAIMFDPTAKTETLVSGATSVAYAGGALGLDGNIYAVPSAVNTKVLQINPTALTETELTAGSSAGLYAGAVLTGNGTIFAIPAGATTPMSITTTATPTFAYGTTAASGTTPTATNGVLAQNGMIYTAPTGATQSVVEYNPTTLTGSVVLSAVPGVASYAVLGTTGQILMVPTATSVKMSTLAPSFGNTSTSAFATTTVTNELLGN